MSIGMPTLIGKHLVSRAPLIYLSRCDQQSKYDRCACCDGEVASPAAVVSVALLDSDGVVCYFSQDLSCFWCGGIGVRMGRWSATRMYAVKPSLYYCLTPPRGT